MFLIAICTVCIMLTLLYGVNNQRKLLTPKGETRVLTQTGVLVVFAAVLIIISTLRYGFIDTYAYKIMYRRSRGDLVYVNSAPWDVEAGWLYLMYYLNYITASPKIMLFMVAVMVNVAYVRMCQKYSSNVIFSLFIYFCIGYLDTNNGLRQCFAASITMMAFPLLLSKKYIPYILLVAFSSIFHESAIYVLLIALVALGKPFNIKVIVALMASLVFLMAPDIISGFIQESTIDNKYNDYFSNDIGMGFIRCFIISIVPLVLAIAYYMIKKKQGQEIDKTDGVLINMLVMNSAFYLMGLYMQYWARLAFYTSFAPIVLLPKLIDGIFSSKDSNWIKWVAYILYFVFFAYNIYVNIAYGAIEDFRIEWW